MVKMRNPFENTKSCRTRVGLVRSWDRGRPARIIQYSIPYKPEGRR